MTGLHVDTFSMAKVVVQFNEVDWRPMPSDNGFTGSGWPSYDTVSDGLWKPWAGEGNPEIVIACNCRNRSR